MFSRALLVALCIVYATTLTPLSAPGDDDCALYLTGPGRSSAYDYSLNLLKGNFAYDGQHTCITYEAINQAYLDARTRILVSQPKGDWKAEHFASVGELVLDISISLARTYGLTYEEIEKGLPLIDTSRTLIREVCPPVFSHVECRAGKYRRLDGLCNNLVNPTWGATMAPFQRLIGPLFSDGINAPRISHTGRDLPLSRVVSRTMHPDDGFHDHAGTVMVIAWGQFMDHDYTLTGTPLDPIHRNDPEECCKRPPHLKHPYCNEIRIPDDDYFYRLFGVKCIDFVRGFPSPRPGCRLGSRVPFNTLTGALDGNTVYGVTEKFSRKLRTGYGGLLRMNPVFKEYGLKDLLPLKLDIPDEGCTRPNKNMFCFEAGEIRVNEQLVLTVMHTLMAREHNRVAEALASVNPHWDDETLYQEARRINIAEIQHITYNEFLPILLGKDVMEKFGLVLEKEGYWEGYDQNVNPDVIAGFAAAAYRFGHSLLPTAVERWSKAHKFIASKRLSDLIRRPYDLYRAGVLDEYVMGLMNQVAQAMDDSITQEVTNHLFKKVGARFGMDLVSLNMQRGREFGLPGYMEFRKFCGLSGANSFQDLFGSMANETIRKYETIFEHPVDVDLWSGGVSERPLPGSMLGPTFACIIATQFSYSRRGDRFWFELPNQPSSFTPEQLAEIRKARLARIICDNTDIIDTVQLYPMVLPDHELNPRVPCRSGIIPSMDFSKWAEPAPFGSAKEYMTDAIICNGTIEDTATIENVTNEGCSINDTSNFVKEDCNDNELIIEVPQNIELNSNNNEVNNNLDDCAQGSKSLSNNVLNSSKNSDKVLKYIYNKMDTGINNKTKGHSKNSLKRKKRSLLSDSEYQSYKTPRRFQINDHKIDREDITVPPIEPQGFIKNSDLADFNIETLHENIKPSINILLQDKESFPNKGKEKYHTKKYHSDEIESNEFKGEGIIDYNNDSQNTEKESNDYNEQEEKDLPQRIKTKDEDKNFEESLNNQSYGSSEDAENISRDYSEKNKNVSDKDKNESNESIDKNGRFFDSDDSSTDRAKNFINENSESNEHEKLLLKEDEDITKNLPNKKHVHKADYHYDDEDKREYRKENNQNLRDNEENEKGSKFAKIESFEKDLPASRGLTNIDELKNQSENDENSSENIKTDDSKSKETSSDSVENFEDFDENKRLNKSELVFNSKENNNLSVKENNFEEISQQTIKNNKDHINSDSVEESNSKESLEESLPALQNTLEKPDTYSNPQLSKSSPSNDIESKNEKQININDGEIKPVKELNNEDSNSQSEEESKEDEESGEIKQIQEYNKNNLNNVAEKPLFPISKTLNENVKSQFERIPENYKHTNNKSNDEEKAALPKNNDEEGTLDILAPDNDNDNDYDKDLNIKFSDLTIKLPDIKLPKDILAYTREDSENLKEHHKNKKDEDTEEEEDTEELEDAEEEGDYDYSDFNKNKKYDNVKQNKDKFYQSYFYPQKEDASSENPQKKASYFNYDDNDEDLYEKFVRERFGKTGNLKSRSEKLIDYEPIRNNKKLYKSVRKVLKRANKIEKEAKNSKDPNYMWTLEYGGKL